MKIDHKKASMALSAIWVLISIPISEHLYQQVLDGGLFMRIFALLTVASPVWLHYGLQWLTNGTTIQRKYLVGIIVLGGGLAFMFAESLYWDELAYIPLITTIFFAVLSQANCIFSGQGIEALRSPKKRLDAHMIAPDKLQKLEAVRSKARPLLDITHDLATEILGLLQSHGARSPMPAAIHADADAVKAAYALVYAAYMQKCVKDPAHPHTAIMVMYQATMSQNLLPLVIPKIPNTPPLSQSDMESEAFRAPVREMIKLQGKLATEALANIEAKNPNPLLPVYQNFKPFFSPKTTDDELAAMFEKKFNEMFATAKKEVFLVLL
ncbi:hypothetical protein SAMN05421641_11820 [Paracoccus thiocyanatus]|uniref:Uncharacterized protein n=1 Tax=Paracoccus thiocyanatus TaxID=34006 RepID=A0A1N6WTB4_9RHOB|nr:hypothetical protein [Paracoccus thiocyanatus]SIQ93300.1 hypothetical protein SAMN05421641_11820 [Paracoccus thiocyanatus]